MLEGTDGGVPILQSASARRRRLVMPMLVVLVAGILVMLMAGRGQQSRIIGAGSTLAQPLIERSAGAFANAQNADNPDRARSTGSDWVVDGSGVEYEPVGSLGGIMRLSDPEVDFAVSDYPLDADALASVGGGQFPIALGAVAVVHNAPLPSGAELNLDATTVAGIYLREITRWNDEAIAALNPGVDLPDLAITPVHRSDGSGSTYGLTSYLTQSSTKWAAGPGSGATVTWPSGTPAERTSGMVAALQETQGAIGYVEHGQARRAGLATARLANPAGAFAAPSQASMEAAIAGVDWSGRDDYVARLPISGKPAAYPMTVAIYTVLKRDPAFTTDTSRTLGYLDFLMSSYDGAAADLGYLPLPPAAAEQIRQYQTRTFAAAV